MCNGCCFDSHNLVLQKKLKLDISTIPLIWYSMAEQKALFKKEWKEV